jgi:hypothetical protein
MDLNEENKDSYHLSTKKEKVFGTLVMVMLFILTLSFILYKVIGFDEIVKNMYYGRSFDFLNDLIKHQQTKPVEHYINLANSVFCRAFFMTVLVLAFVNLIVCSILFRKATGTVWTFLFGTMIKIRYRLIAIISLVYIFVPSVLFCGGWLKPCFSIPAILLILSGIYLCSRKDETENLKGEEFFRISFFDISVVLGLVFVIVFLSGIGGYTNFQVGDQVKHNAFLYDLIEYDWPIGYENLGPQKKSYALVTYVGYYLPSALVGKMFGCTMASHFSFLWGYLGVLLTIVWFYRVVGKVSIFLALLFLFFAGLDIIGFIIIKKSFWVIAPYLDYWLITPRNDFLNYAFWVYPANLSLLYVGPHHVLPNWLPVLMVVHYGFICKTSKNLIFLSSACAVGSVFVFIGLLPYILIAIIFNKAKKLFTFQNMIAAPMLVMVIGLFTISNNSEYPHGFVWKFHSMGHLLPRFTLFCFLEFGLYALLCPKIDAKGLAIPHRLLWFSSITLLFIWPWYLMGRWCDFTTKTSIPSLLIFLVCLTVAMINATGRKQLKFSRILKILLIIGACSGVCRMLVVMTKGVRLNNTALKRYHIDECVARNWETGSQLFADPADSFFWNYLAKEPSMN